MRKYWKSLDEFRNLPDREKERFEGEHKNSVLELFEDATANSKSSRRDFLKLFGFSLTSAALVASCEKPVKKAIPYVIKPEEITPGKALYYASSFFDGKDFCSILVKNRDGRPIKIEGNELAAFNRGGTTARIQASVLSLYDDARLKKPSISGKKLSWDELDADILTGLKNADASGKETVLLTSAIISPSTRRIIDDFGKSRVHFRWVTYSPVSYSGILEANEKCFGQAFIPDYRFDKADLVVSFGADFLGSWIAPVRFIRLYTDRRKLDSGQKTMIRHIQVESGLSLTGSNADSRYMMKPSEEKALLLELYNLITGKTGSTAVRENIDMNAIASELIRNKGRSVVLSGSNDPDCQILVNAINYTLDNISSTIDISHPLLLAGGRDQDIAALVDDMNAGKIGALLMYNVNPVYDYPDAGMFLTGLQKIPLTVSFAGSACETAALATHVCPVHHPLESWDDAEISPGSLYLTQPCISPIFNTRSFQDSLLNWNNAGTDYYHFIQTQWKANWFSGQGDFTTFWNACLRDGLHTYQVEGEWKPEFNAGVLEGINIASSPAAPGFEVILAESVQMGDGRHANNPWLQELPDPVSKHDWENVLMISPSDAQESGLQNGDIVRLNGKTEMPVLVQPGQANGTCLAALGYGRKDTGKVANGVGVNLYPLVQMTDGRRIYHVTGVKLEPAGRKTVLALTQMHNSMEGRHIVRETRLKDYLEKPSSGNETLEEFEAHNKTLYPEPEFKGFHWGMVVDLNACVGCNTCVIACQAENNIPVVGKSEVYRRRIMHWMKIDRYYSDEPGNPSVFFQPIMCQHCDNAPCENVCPVSATNHSSEGLNQMTYNRCIGTKYCINNCPYRVRRFNWFKYTDNKKFDYDIHSDLGQMVLNPDVVVRDRGVVEKCSFCVQRIQEKKLQAKLENRALSDGEIKPACVQACPAGALVFGDMNDPESRVSKLMKDPRNYHLLEEIHTLPSVGYLTQVRNKPEGNIS